MTLNKCWIFTFLLAFSIINSQIIQYNGFIQTRKLFLFGPDNGFEFAQFKSTHSFLFQRQFDNVPRVGLAVYTIDFQYSPDFSCRITAATNKTATAIQITSSGSDTNNRLYIMYMATDNQQMGIFVPDRLQTSDLSLPTRTKSSQNFDFNFKEQISQLATKFTDISITVYLTGLSTTSQMTNNGFPTNRTSVSIRASSTSTRFYTVQVMIGQDFPFILLDWIEFTVVYFIPQILINNRYQINSGAVTLKAFGGTVEPVTQSVDLLPLTVNNKFENLKFFYGINRIECKDGNSVTLLGVQKYYTSTQDSSIRLLLQMQTWKLTYMQVSSFNYIQYKSLKCSQPGANCPTTCSSGLRPFYIVQGQCNYCHYSCLTCNLTNLDSYCDTCHQTRKINNATHLCDCLAPFYQTYKNFTCASCFPCATCQKADTCLTCLDKDNMILNTVTSLCECKGGYFANKVNEIYVASQPCMKCSKDCLYCTSATNCKACSVSTYLSEGICIPICKQNERFITVNNTCQLYDGDLFDQEGRLDFDWSYKLGQNQMIIDLIFSQTNMSYYYFENGVGYTYQDYIKQLKDGGNTAGSSSGSSFYYDDGINYGGYQKISADASGSSGSSSSSDSSSPSANGSGGSSSTAAIIDDSVLKGQYYGYGQTRFFQLLYENETVQYKNQYGIPYGKYNVSTTPPIVNPNYIDALSKNLVFKISGIVTPYTMQGVSNNRFTLRTRPSKTYINALGAIQVKNPALCRAGKTALQKNIVTKQINRFDFYTQAQLNTATNIKSSNSVLVNILWGVCKYFLFVGFGWPFIPIMLALQYIMSFNYIHSSLPLNLDRFLASFRDFRNPSILYNPLRNEFDAKVVNHPNIYKSIPEFQQFDRGLDFMKNCWEFFFVPILACALLGLFYLLNLLFRKCCRRDFCLISKYLVPRAPLLIAAYTLVQALPVSFFFFAQLKDTTFRHPLQPNIAYPTFNTAIAYLAFFLTCAIPILLLSWLYYHFNYGNRISKFSDANVFNRKFLNRIDNDDETFSRARLQDPLWGGHTTKTSSYIFGIAVFALAIIFGFFLAFFIKDFAWQLAGIIFFTVLFLAFVVAASFFTSRVFKVFFIIMTLLMLAYLLLHAGIGSNRAIGTYDQWNTGYLGIGILYALLITAILFTAYLLYKMFKQMYRNHQKFGCWINIDKENQVPADRKQVQRVTQYKRDTKLRSTFLKNGVSGMGGQSGVQNNLYVNTLASNVKKVPLNEDENLYSEQRMIVRNYQHPDNTFDELVLNKQDSYKKQMTFVSKDRNMVFGFPQENGRMLLTRRPIYIDGQNRIYDKNKEFIDYYFNLAKKLNQIETNSRRDVIVSQKRVVNQPGYRTNEVKTITTNKKIFVIEDVEYQMIGEEMDGNVKLKNMRTGQIKLFPMKNFQKSSSSLLKYNSTSKIKSPEYQMQQRLSKVYYPTRNIIYNGQQYVDLGYDSSSKKFKIINAKNNQIQNIEKTKYINMVEESNKKRINIGNDEYDYQGTDANGRVYLLNNSTGEQMTITSSEFEKYRRDNLKFFYNNLDQQMAQNQDKNSTVIYQGQQYETYGIDDQGRHRLFNPKTNKTILLSEMEFRGLYGTGNKLATGSENLLLLQSAVGTMKKANTQKEQQMVFDSETSRYYIFHQVDGSKIYIPKSKINPDLPIEIDEDGNVQQNNKIILGRQQTRRQAGHQHYERKTETIINSTKKITPQNIRMSDQAQGYVIEDQLKQELNADDAINPDSYYKIFGIPEQKVINYEYKPKDIFLTQRNIRGRQVMQRIQKIQTKYPNLALLVKNQSDQSEEFWLN